MNDLSKWQVGAAAAVAILSAPAVASATVSGSIGLTAIGGASAAPSSDLASATSVSISGPFFTAGNGVGDMSSILAGSTVSISTTTYAVTGLGVMDPITSFTLSAGSVTFDFTSQELTVKKTTGSGLNQSTTLAIEFFGTATGPISPNPELRLRNIHLESDRWIGCFDQLLGNRRPPRTGAASRSGTRQPGSFGYRNRRPGFHSAAPHITLGQTALLEMLAFPATCKSYRKQRSKQKPAPAREA